MSRESGDRLVAMHEANHILTGIEKQRLHIHRTMALPSRPCPFCNCGFNLYDATNDLYDVESDGRKLHMDCPSCGLVVSDNLSFLGGVYFWGAIAPASEDFVPRTTKRADRQAEEGN